MLYNVIWGGGAQNMSFYALSEWDGPVFSNGTMLSVSEKSESVNERTHTNQQKNKIPYSSGSQEVLRNSLGSWINVFLW